MAHFVGDSDFLSVFAQSDRRIFMQAAKVDYPVPVPLLGLLALLIIQRESRRIYQN